MRWLALLWAFHASVGPAPAHMDSWHPGCPVPVSQLRLVTLSYWSFEGVVHDGRLVVNRDAVVPIVRVFRSLYDAQYPVRRMVLVDRYGASDDRSMAADNTSAFNCRRIARSSSWSQHAYGRAIDVNPRENPTVHADGSVSPVNGARFANRSRRARAMIHAGDAVVRAFASVGWGWGGAWAEPDYQHFSANGH